jgi:hypothetical protein
VANNTLQQDYKEHKHRSNQGKVNRKTIPVLISSKGSNVKDKFPESEEEI